MPVHSCKMDNNITFPDKFSKIYLIIEKSIVKLFNEMEETGSLHDIFPEIAASAIAIDRLKRNKLPEGFNKIDRIVVDEIQDLTLLEISVIIELCRTIYIYVSAICFELFC